MKALEIIVKNRDELEKWLAKNYTSEESVWLIYYKKASGKGNISYSEIVDCLLCYGWIDSQARGVDAEKSSIRISPRNPKSNWSRVNKAKVAQLIADKRMHPSGLAMVELAKKTGTWDALNDVEDLILPPDLKKALTSGKLLDKWEAQSRSTRRMWLEMLLNAKLPQTKEKLIKKISTSLQS